MKKTFIGAALAALFAFSAPAMAVVTICDGPGCAPTDANVLIDKDSSPVTGSTQGGTGVLFTSTTDTLIGDANGQASVSASDGLLNNLKFALTDGQTFGAATFNLFPLPGNQPNEATQVLLTWLLEGGGTASGLFDINKNGQNFTGIFGTTERFISLEFLANPATTGWGDFRQLRLGDIRDRNGGVIDPQIGGVPEPTTWMTMILGFGMIGMVMRKKSKAVSRVRFG